MSLTSALASALPGHAPSEDATSTAMSDGCPHQQHGALLRRHGTEFAPHDHLAWLAGLLDGDGSIYLDGTTLRLSNRISINHSPDFAQLVQWGRRYWGGSYGRSEPSVDLRRAPDAAFDADRHSDLTQPLAAEAAGPDRQTKAAWSFGSDDSARLLAHLLPHLRIKHHRAGVQLRLHHARYGLSPAGARAELPAEVVQVLRDSGAQRRPLTAAEAQRCHALLDAHIPTGSTQPVPPLEAVIQLHRCPDTTYPDMPAGDLTDDDDVDPGGRAALLSYAAGLFEAEGSVTLTLGTCTIDRQLPSLAVKADLRWTQLDAAHLWPQLAVLWHAHPTVGDAPQYCLQGHAALLALLELLPQLTLKRSQAELMLRTLAPGRASTASTVRDLPVLHAVQAALRACKVATHQQLEQRTPADAVVDAFAARAHRMLDEIGTPTVRALLAWAHDNDLLGAASTSASTGRTLATMNAGSAATPPATAVPPLVRLENGDVPLLAHIDCPLLREGIGDLRLIDGQVHTPTGPLYSRRARGSDRLAAALVGRADPLPGAVAAALLWPSRTVKDPEGQLRTMLYQLREKIEPYGLTTVTERGRGSSLVPLRQAGQRPPVLTAAQLWADPMRHRWYPHACARTRARLS